MKRRIGAHLFLAIALAASALAACETSDGMGSPMEPTPAPVVVAPIPPPAPSPPPMPASPPQTSSPVCPGYTQLKPIDRNWPSPTVTVTFKAAPLVAGKPNATVYDVAQSLTQRLAQAGYPQPKYLGVGCNGVAVAANFEAILNSGKRKPGLSGFPASSEEAAPGLPGAVDFVIGLFYAPPGYYRRVLFVVTDAAPPTTSGEATDEELRNLVSGGSTYLPLAYRAAPLNSSHQIIAWIYEFKLEPGSDKAGQVAASGSPAKGLLTALGHLRAAGIFQQLPQ